MGHVEGRDVVVDVAVGDLVVVVVAVAAIQYSPGRRLHVVAMPSVVCLPQSQEAKVN